MKMLYCYGITRHALQLLQPNALPQSTVPNGWFNWINANNMVEGGRAIQRLQYLDPEQSAESVIRWNQTARQAGYGCVLVYSTLDPALHTDNAPGLSADVVLHPISHVPTEAERAERISVLALLREPEDFFVDCWDAVTWGGGANIDHLGLGHVPLAQWWAYGQGLGEWIRKTAMDLPDSKYRINCPDFSSWNSLKAQGIDHPDTKLDIRWCWDSPRDDVWRWNLDNPCTPRDIPEMSDLGLVAYYPMRQMPCCGLARHQDGRLLTIGALPDEKGVDGAWRWDDGTIQNKLIERTSYGRDGQGVIALVARVRELIQSQGWSSGPPGVAYPFRGLASSEKPPRIVHLNHGNDEVNVRYDGVRIEIDPTSRAGPTAIKTMWLTAFVQNGDQTDIVGQWMFKNQWVSAPFEITQHEVAFTVSDTPLVQE